METTATPPKQENLASLEELNQSALQASFEHYMNVHGEAIVDANYRLLEPLIGQTNQEPKHPALTICIPIAINREQPERISQTLDIIAAATQQLGRPVDVILWTNAKFQDEASQEAVTQAAHENYTALRAQLEARADTNVSIRTALQVLPVEEATMSKLRANYMDAVAKDLVERELGYDHPVVWMDVDTTAMSSNSLEEIEDKVRNFDAMFVHPVTRYSLDWAKDTPPAEWDDATKAVAVHEIQRRQMLREEIKSKRPRLYFEEPGLAFAIGTYLDLDGVDTSRPIHESSGLLNRASARWLQAASAYRNVHGWDAPIPPGFHFGPSFIHLKRPKGGLRPGIYIPGTSMTMSDRRLYEEVKQHGAAALATAERNDNYRLFSDFASDDAVAAPPEPTMQEILEHADRPEAQRYTTKAQQKVARMVVRRLFGG